MKKGINQFIIWRKLVTSKTFFYTQRRIGSTKSLNSSSTYLARHFLFIYFYWFSYLHIYTFSVIWKYNPIDNFVERRTGFNSILFYIYIYIIYTWLYFTILQTIHMCTVSNYHGRIKGTKNEYWSGRKPHIGDTKWIYIYISNFQFIQFLFLPSLFLKLF